MADFLTDEQMAGLESSEGFLSRESPQTAPAGFISDEDMTRLDSVSGQDSAPASAMGPLQTGLETAVDTAGLGYLPHLQAFLERFGPDPSGGVDDQLRSEGFKISQPQDSYVALRDENISRQAAGRRANPNAATAGTIAGIGGGMLIPMGAAARGATLGAKAISAGKIGALMGGLANPGDVKGEMTAMPAERLQNALMGMGIGAASAPAVRGLEIGFNKMSGALSKRAAEKAVKALGPKKSELEKLMKTGQEQALGRMLLDDGAIPVLGTPGRITNRVNSIKKKAGEEIGSIIDSAGKTPHVDGSDIGVRLLDDPKYIEALRTPGMESYTSEVEKAAEKIAASGKLSLKEAQKLRQNIDKSINFNKGPAEMRGKQEALFDSRTQVRDLMNDVVNALDDSTGKGSTNRLKKANRRYGLLEGASDILNNKMSRDGANRTISLTDYISGVGGASAGGPAAAGLMALANKGVRTFGDSAAARLMNAGSKLSSKVPVAASRGAPLSVATIVRDLSSREEKKKGQGQPIDPRIMQIFKQSPALIDSIQDDKVRADIKKQIGRDPALTRLKALQPEDSAGYDDKKRRRMRLLEE